MASVILDTSGLGSAGGSNEPEYDKCSQLLGTDACLTWAGLALYRTWITVSSWLETFTFLVSYGLFAVFLWWLITYLTDRFLSFDLESNATKNKKTLEDRLAKIEDKKAMVVKKLETAKKTHGHIKSTMLQLEKTVELKEQALKQIYKTRKELEAMQMETHHMKTMMEGHTLALEQEPDKDVLGEEIRFMESVLDEAKMALVGFKRSVPSDAENQAMALLIELMKLKQEEEKIQNTLVKLGISDKPTENPWGKSKDSEEWLDVMIKEFTRTSLEDINFDSPESKKSSLNKQAEQPNKTASEMTDGQADEKLSEKEQYYFDMIIKEELENWFQNQDFEDNDGEIVTAGAQKLQKHRENVQTVNDNQANESHYVDGAESVSDSSASPASLDKNMDGDRVSDEEQPMPGLWGLDEQHDVENAEHVNSDDEHDCDRVVEYNHEVVLRLPPKAVLQTVVGRSVSQESLNDDSSESETDILMAKKLKSEEALIAKCEQVDKIDIEINALKHLINSGNLTDEEIAEAKENIEKLENVINTIKAELEDIEVDLHHSKDDSAFDESEVSSDDILPPDLTNESYYDDIDDLPVDGDSLIEADPAALQEELQHLRESLQDSKVSLMQDLLSAEDIRQLDDGNSFTGDSILNDEHTGVHTEIQGQGVHTYFSNMHYDEQVQNLEASEDEPPSILPESYIQHHGATNKTAPAGAGAHGDVTGDCPIRSSTSGTHV